MIDLRISRARVTLRRPLTIARGTYTHGDLLLYRLCAAGFEGLGETAPSTAFAEDPVAIEAHLRRNGLASDDPADVLRCLPFLPPSPRCGLDTAVYDLIGKQRDVPLYELLGLEPSATPSSSVTVGIAGIAETLERVRGLVDVPVLKLKVGLGGEPEMLEAVRSVYGGTIRIDANEGWTPEYAVSALRLLEPYAIELCEQPIAAGSPERLRYVRERVNVPIFADEDARTAEDVARLDGCVDGVCIMLARCGGIDSALAMISAARERGMKTMLGCRIESSLINTAAAHLSPLVDYADLDAPIANALDPFTGLTYGPGMKIVLPIGPGLGVERHHDQA